MRNDLWLTNKLEKLWQEYFSDVPIANSVHIKFGKKARTRLGSIKQVKTHRLEPKSLADTLITLTAHFKDERVPEYIIDLTIAHELCHYAHGFSSPLPQLCRHPHKGGIVDKELEKRGFKLLLKQQREWLKAEWPKIIGHKTIRRRGCKKVYTLRDAIRLLINP